MDHEQQPGDSEPAPNNYPGEQRETPSDTTPRIWVGSLSDYNNGVLHGDWIDAARELEEIYGDIQAVLRTSPWTVRTGELAEEWGIFDTDNFGTFHPGEYADIAWVSAVATGIRDHGLAYAAWANYVGEPDRLTDFNEAYLGHYDSLRAYVEQMIVDLGYDELLDQAIPASIRQWVKIDYDMAGRDLQFGGDIFTEPADDGGIWVFNTS